MSDYRAQCANCLASTRDRSLKRCPACGSPRMVVFGDGYVRDYVEAGRRGGNANKQRIDAQKEAP